MIRTILICLLLAHTDSWALASGSKKPEGDGKNPMSEADAKPPMANLESMDGPALRAYAQQHFGHEFHHNAGEAKMRQTIIGLMNRG